MPDIGATRDMWHAGFLLAPLLTCETCPVRRPCLEEGLKTWRSLHHEDERKDSNGITRSYGIWGGSLQKERIAVENMPISEAADVIEAGFPERLERRIAAWKVKTAARKPKISKRGKLIVHTGKSDKIIRELLERRDQGEPAPVSNSCTVCSRALPPRARRGPPRRLCGQRCRKRASRRALAA